VLRCRAASGAGALPHVLAALDDARLAVASATVARPSLDDVYLRHTGHSYSADSRVTSPATPSEGVTA
jgi:ABC-2 type transport system ATP-binding protein